MQHSRVLLVDSRATDFEVVPQPAIDRSAISPPMEAASPDHPPPRKSRLYAALASCRSLDVGSGMKHIALWPGRAIDRLGDHYDDCL